MAPVWFEGDHLPTDLLYELHVESESNSEDDGNDDVEDDNFGGSSTSVFRKTSHSLYPISNIFKDSKSKN